MIDLHIEDPNEAMLLFGPEDAHLKILETMLDVSIVTRGGAVSVDADERTQQRIADVLQTLLALIRKGLSLSDRDVIYAVKMSEQGLLDEVLELYQEKIAKNFKGKTIRIKTLGQRHYIKAIREHDMVFGIGPAGTGKTYLAIVMAVTALRAGDVKRIILTRPAIEAGENLGFLPGDFKEKVDPYLRPLYDALHDVLGVEHTARLIERGTIEIAPLAYMRGRTLDDAFAILDESQNTTPEQMKMFLTRLGFGSKMVVNGDETQVDLPKGKQSGLQSAKHILTSVADLAFVYLEQTDVVRHPLVQKVIDAYETSED